MTQMDAEFQMGSRSIPSIRILSRGDPTKVLLRARKKSNEIVHLRFGLSDYHLIIHPKLIQEVLVTKQSYFGKDKYIGIFIPTIKAFQRGLLSSPVEFEPHDKQRQMRQPAFHQERIVAYSKTMTYIAKAVSDGWVDHGIIDVHEEMVLLTTIIVAKCLFGADIGPEAKDIGRDLTTIAAYYERLSSPVSSLLVRLPSNRKYDEAVIRIKRLFSRLVDERRATGSDRGDLLSMILAAKNERGMRMTEEQLRDELGLFFIVGHETSANALTWIWYLLSQNPTVEDKLHAEVDRLFPDYEVPSAEDISKLDYTMKIIHETLRLYPSAWSMVRRTLRDCKLGEFFIPAGSNIWIAQYLNNRDPELYPKPNQFVPERWTEDFKKSLPPFAYFPFGGGSRRCIGEPFAWMEISLLVGMLSRRWRMRHLEGHKVIPQTGISLRPKYGMKMLLERR